MALLWHPYRRNSLGGQANLNQIQNQSAEMIQLWCLMPLSYRSTALASIDNGVSLSWGSIRLILPGGLTEILVRIMFYKKAFEKIFRIKSLKDSQRSNQKSRWTDSKKAKRTNTWWEMEKNVFGCLLVLVLCVSCTTTKDWTRRPLKKAASQTFVAGQPP